MRDKTKKLVYVDMDSVLCDFVTPFELEKKLNPEQPFPQSRMGFFIDLLPIEGAIESFKKLEEKYDVWILSRPSVQNINCYSEKALWVKKYLGIEVQKKLILACDKSLLKGDYLIDDALEHGQSEFEGELIHFGQEKFKDWKSVVNYLM